MNSTLRYSLSIILPLVAGLSIYLLFRSDTSLIGSALGLQQGLFLENIDASPLSYFLAFCVPDGLWCLTLLQTNALIHHVCGRNEINLLDLLVLILPFGIELAQMTDWMPGTFDLWDILTYIFTYILYFLWIKKESSHACS